VDVRRDTGVGAVGETSRSFDIANRCAGLIERATGDLT
jgi:hypothetical protein